MRDRLNRTSGAVRFTSVAAANAEGDAKWRFQHGETIVLTANYTVTAPVNSLSFLIYLRSALDDKLITSIRKTLSLQPMKAGETGTIELVLPDIPLRPGEISLYICLGRDDDAVFYDVLDANVDLPLISMEADAGESTAKQGLVSLPHDFRHTRHASG